MERNDADHDCSTVVATIKELWVPVSLLLTPAFVLLLWFLVELLTIFFGPPAIGPPSVSTIACGEKEEDDNVNLSFLDTVVDALLEVVEVR